MTKVSPIETISHIGGVSAEAWLCDIWGVLHNGVAAFPSAVTACRTFRARGGIVILITNAPRPSESVVAQLDALGVPRDAYDAVLTSGDVTRATLETWRGIPTLHLGPARDRGLFDGLDVPLAPVAIAQRVLCSGLEDDTVETPESYRDVLADLVVRQVPMLCANPDITVDRGGQVVYCAGAIAALYEHLGGPVAYAGKPHAPIYARAMTLLADRAGRDIPIEKIVAIGDGVNTDILGGITAGYRTVYVASPVHLYEAMTEDALDRLFTRAGSRPAHAMTALTW